MGEERATSTDAHTRRFVERALAEAQRYGDDPWVFVRELLQNARDAGATVVRISTARAGETVRVACRDNGEGMTFDHARRYLFRLYATSKQGDTRAAGRFGVGFWSILRFAPQRIIVRSWPHTTVAGWEVEIDGTLSQSRHSTLEPNPLPGTEIVLERAADTPDLLERIARAAWDEGRFLTRRDRPCETLGIIVNGGRISAPFDLPAPRTRFRHGRARGVVALGTAPSVELFASGLRVRTAHALDDLLNPFGAQTKQDPQEQPSAHGASPRVLLDSPDLRLHLTRSDARDDRELRRLVERARREIARLVARQIDALRPRTWLQRLGDPLRDSLTWRAMLTLGLACLGSLALAAFLAAHLTPAPRVSPGATSFTTAATVGTARPRPPIPLGDLAAQYRGPKVETPTAEGPRLALAYRPAYVSPHLAVLVVPWAQLLEPSPLPIRRQIVGPYKAPRSPAENETSLTIQVQIAAGTRRAQLPVPTGHRIIPSSVKLGDTPVGIRSSSFDEAIVDLTPADRILELSYRTAPGAPLSSLAGLGHVPEELRPRVEALRALPLPERPTVAWESIRHALRYAVDADTVARHAELASQGVPAVQRALRVGAGDCDAINGVLAVLLAAAGVEARLVVGPVGIQGRAGGMHAWVEYRHSGPWRALDATVTTAPPPGTRPADDQPVRAGPNPQSREPRPPEEGGAPISGILLLGIALASFSAVTASVLTLRRRRSSSHTQLDPRQGLAALLRGAIEHPQAFASAPAVFDRRLLPLRSGGRISLGEAWRLADGRRLHGARGVTGLARRAARGGHRVLDLRDPEAELVALTLGATDLDAWESALSRAPRRPLLQTVSLAVSGAGWELDLRSARVRPGQAPGPVSTLDLAIGSRGCLLTTAILWDDGSWLPELDGLFASRPAEATLRCAERVAEALALDDERCQEWRRRLARQALHEASR